MEHKNKFVIIHNAVREKMSSDFFTCKARSYRIKYKEGELGLQHDAVREKYGKHNSSPILFCDSRQLTFKSFFSQYYYSLFSEKEFIKLKSQKFDDLIDEAKVLYNGENINNVIESIQKSYLALKNFDPSMKMKDSFFGKSCTLLDCLPEKLQPLREIIEENIEKQEKYLKEIKNLDEIRRKSWMKASQTVLD